MAKSPNWTQKDKDLLISVYQKENKEYILSLFPNRNWNGIKLKATRMGVYRLNYFTEYEIQFIKDNYVNMTLLDLSAHIGRNPDCVENKMIELGIVRQEKWSKEDADILISYFGMYDVAYISEHILPKRTTSSIYHKCQELGLSRETDRYSKETLLELLNNLSIKLERTPTCKELIRYGLPGNSVYIKHFGGYNVACEILGLDINATIFKQTKYYYSKNLDICRSKSEQIITDFLIDNNINYLMDKSYKSICKIGLYGRKRYDWLLDNNTVVEYFGLNRHKKYQEKMKTKIELCALNNLELIQIFDKDIFKLENIFKKFYKN